MKIIYRISLSASEILSLPLDLHVFKTKIYEYLFGLWSVKCIFGLLLYACEVLIAQLVVLVYIKYTWLSRGVH